MAGNHTRSGVTEGQLGGLRLSSCRAVRAGANLAGAEERESRSCSPTLFFVFEEQRLANSRQIASARQRSGRLLAEFDAQTAPIR